MTPAQPAEYHLRVDRTARFYTSGVAGADTREVWIVCHGYAQLARNFIRAFEPIAGASRLVVAPEALNRYYVERAPGQSAQQARVGATWMTREDREHEIEDYIACLDAVAARVLLEVGGAADTRAAHAVRVGAAADRRVRTVALGFSQGAATVSRWAARGTAHLDHVVLWGAGLAHELAPARGLFRGAALTIAAGSTDRQFDEGAIARQLDGLRDTGVEATLLRYEGGHRIEPAALRELADQLHGP